jgi:phage tail sheath protein FI
MPSYTYPGVYIEEVAGAPAAIGSASPSTGAMIGGGLSGPTNEPILVTSFPEYVSRFGSFNTLSRMATSAFAFFTNGGQLLRVVRVVPTDATTASGYLSEEIVAEALTPDAGTLSAVFAAFTGANGTIKTPIASGSVVITVTGGGAGFATNLTDVATAGVLANTSGATGTIDYETGEITISGPAGSTLNAPATFDIDYDYKTFTFVMDWAGASGDDIGITIQGDPNYQDIATASFTRFIVSIVNTATGVTLESYDAISFTDPSSPSFIASVLNDATAGSGYVNVVAEGNNESPTVFFGDLITAEALATQTPAYNGTVRSFAYTLTNDVSPFSLTASFAFQGAAVSSTPVVGSTFALSAGDTVLTFPLPSAYQYLSQDVAAGRLTIAAARLDLNGTILVASACPDGATPVFGSQTFTYTGSTNAFAVTVGTIATADIVAGSSGIALVGGNLVATITLAAVTSPQPEFNPAAVTFAATSAIAPTSAYALGTVLIADDGDGNIVDLGTGTAVALELDTNAATNGINYTTGVLSATWIFTDNPSRGPASASAQTATYYTQAAVASATLSLSGGADGSALTRSVVSAPALSADAKGLYALNRVEEILNICIPDFETDPIVSGDLIDYCETRKDRFCVVSVPQGLDNNQAVNYKRQTLAKNSSRAAIYYPHIRIIDPVTENEVLQPAGGHMLGILARTDSVANVSTAPAGTTRGALSFSVGLEFKMTPEQAGVTNQACVNNLVEFPYTGRVVWGARTLQVNGEFPYIQMRRLFIYLEKSIFNSTQQFVFENNGAALQARVRITVEAFLLNLYNAGYFSGTTPAQAFFVVCDSTNNPPERVAQGILTCDIGVSPTRPAEFIVFRFQQKALE